MSPDGPDSEGETVIDLLLTGGTVVTVDADRRVLLDGAVAIDKGRIVAVGPSDELGQQYQATKTIDLQYYAIHAYASTELLLLKCCRNIS